MNWLTGIVWVPLPTAALPLAVTTCADDPDPIVSESPFETGKVSPDTVSDVYLVATGVVTANAVFSVVTGVTDTGTLIKLVVSAGGWLAVAP
jgi:hypothetical protein